MSRVFTNRSQLVGLRRSFVVHIPGGEGVRRTGEGDSERFLVPMHGTKAVGALHEPERGQPCPRGHGCPRSSPAMFMTPMHAHKRKGTLEACHQRVVSPYGNA